MIREASARSRSGPPRCSTIESSAKEAPMRYAIPTVRSICLLMLLGTGSTLRAQAVRPDSSQLTVDRLEPEFFL